MAPKRPNDDAQLASKRARKDEHVLLDSAAFPHLWRLIISHAPYPLLLSLRRVNRASRDVADAVLFRHVRVTPQLPLDHSDSFDVLGWVGDTLRRLPIGPIDPALERGAYIVPAHTGWAAVRSFDHLCEFFAPGEAAALMPALERVRGFVFQRRNHPPAPTVVVGERIDRNLFECSPSSSLLCDGVGVTRHVVTVRFQRDVPAMSWDPVIFIGLPDYFEKEVHGVFIFDEVPDGYDEEPESDEELESYGDDVGRMSHEQHESLNESIARDVGRDPPSGRTALHSFLACVAWRAHRRFTFVGLETVPREALEKEFGVTIRADAGEQWVGQMHGWVVAAIHRIHSSLARWLDDEDFDTFVEEAVEVITADEYRLRVGDEAWRFETFADLPPDKQFYRVDSFFSIEA